MVGVDGKVMGMERSGQEQQHACHEVPPPPARMTTINSFTKRPLPHKRLVIIPPSANPPPQSSSLSHIACVPPIDILLFKNLSILKTQACSRSAYPAHSQTAPYCSHHTKAQLQLLFIAKSITTTATAQIHTTHTEWLGYHHPPVGEAPTASRHSRRSPKRRSCHVSTTNSTSCPR